MKIRPLLIILITTCCCADSRAQQELSLYFSEKIPAVNLVNPAAYTNDQLIFSFPSVSFNYGNSAFTFNDLFRKDGDRTLVDVEHVLGKLDKDNILQLQVSAELFSVQFRIKKLYFTVMMAEKASARLSYSRDLIELAWKGNASFVGQEIEIGPAFDMTLYREISLGAVYRQEKYSIGGKLRFLSGRANIVTKNEDAYLYTDGEFYQSTFRTDYEIHTSGLDDPGDQRFGPFAGTGNPGLAVDLGINYRASEKWTFSASLLDLGYIKWKKDTESYITSGEASFNGIHLNKYFEVDTFNFDHYVDSLETEFEPETRYDNYKSSLVPRLYFGIARKLNKKQEIGILTYGEFFDGFRPAFLLYHGYRPLEKTEIGLSYGIKNNLYNHLGLSLAQQIGRVQLYFISDDIVNLFTPFDARSVNFRFGINLFFGKGAEQDSSAP